MMRFLMGFRAELYPLEAGDVAPVLLLPPDGNLAHFEIDVAPLESYGISEADAVAMIGRQDLVQTLGGILPFQGLADMSVNFCHDGSL
jgi:hypothetical protein